MSKNINFTPVEFGNFTDIRVEVKGHLSPRAESELFEEMRRRIDNNVKVCVIIAEFPLKDESPYIVRNYIIDGRMQRVYLYGDVKCIPVQTMSANPRVKFSACIICFIHNGIYYSIRIKDNNRDFLTNIASNTHNVAELRTHISAELNLDMSREKLNALSRVKMDGKNKTLGATWIVSYKYYYCMLSAEATSMFVKKYFVDDTITENTIGGGKIVIIPALYTARKTLYEKYGYVMRNNCEYMTIKSLNCVGYNINTNIKPIYKLNGKYSKIIFD
jgi:hypothetical protein